MTFNFVGGSYQHASLRADAQSSINLYAEIDESGAGKSKAQLVGTPGEERFATLPTQPGRGMWIGEGRMFAVGGSKLYEVFANGSATERGDVGNDGKPCYFASNGNQLAVTSNGFLWVDSGSGPVRPTYPGSSITAVSSHYYAGISSTLINWVSGDKFDGSMDGMTVSVGGDSGVFTYVSPITAYVGMNIAAETEVSIVVPGRSIPASAVTMLDGYAIASVVNSRQYSISAPYDFSSWDALDFAAKEGYPDSIARPLAHHQDLWLFGKQTAEVWVNTGRTQTDASGNLIPLFPFERRPGMVLNIGAVSRDAIDRLSTAIALLSGDEKGSPVATLISGYSPDRISTPAMEKIWAGYSTAADAVSYSYEENGHWFWVLSFPTADATWCYDLTAKEWHQRGYYSGGVLHRAKGAFHGWVWGAHYVLAWDSGKIYRSSLDIFTHDGNPILRQRAAPHLSNENKRLFFSQFTLDVDNGGGAPQFTLEYSNNGGKTWHTKGTSAGFINSDGDYRLVWRRLGQSRPRTFRVTSTAAMRHVWIDAFVEAQAGLH